MPEGDGEAAASTQGIRATDHARFGALRLDTTGPDSVNTHAPSAAAPSVTVRLRNSHVPIAATGSGSATHRLNDTTSDGSRRIASVTGITSWFSASAIAD